jgi:hypothetical protein
MLCFTVFLLGSFCMVFTVAVQTSFSILENTTLAHYSLLGVYEGVNFVFITPIAQIVLLLLYSQSF